MFGKLKDKTPTFRAPSAKYLGGHDMVRQIDGTLVINTEDGARFIAGGKGWTVPWSEITDVRVDPLRQGPGTALLLVSMTDGREMMFQVKGDSNVVQGRTMVLRPFLPA